MGIHKLHEVIKENSPKAISLTQVEKYRGWKVAVDASVVIYQTLVAIRSGAVSLKNSEGEDTSHLYGFLYKTVSILERGITPVFVFDGAPPELKKNTLDKRRERKSNAEKLLSEAQTKEEEIKHAKQAVRATKRHSETAQELLKCLGVPYVVAEGEAEKTCAELNISGRVDGVVSEDMDSLTFGSRLLLKSFFASAVKKDPITEISLEKFLKDIKIDHEEFVDLCILLGCDYCESPKGVGPKKAVELILKHRTIEKIIEDAKIPVPENWKYQEARALFAQEPDENRTPLSLSTPNIDALREFLVIKNGFNKEKVEIVIQRLQKIEKSSKQKTISSFFKKQPVHK